MPACREPPGELHLVLVDVLAEVRAAGHDDRAVPVAAREHDRADAGVRDDHAGAARLLGQLVERHEVDPLAAAVRRSCEVPYWTTRCSSPPRRGGRLDQAVERLLVGADGDEDHRAAKRLPAKRMRPAEGSASSGHCAYMRWATGRIMRPLSESPSIRVTLST